MAAKLLKKKGWKILNEVKNDFANGIDLIISRNGFTFSVEVKRACILKKKIKGKLYNNPRIRPVEGKARDSHLICIINSNMTSVILQPMKDHLKLCTKKTGDRFISGLINLMKAEE